MDKTFQVREDADDKISLSLQASRIASLATAASAVMHSLPDRQRAEVVAIDLMELAAELAMELEAGTGRLESRPS